MFGKILSSTVNICAYKFGVYSFLYVIKYIIVNDYLCHLCGVILTLKSNGCDSNTAEEHLKHIQIVINRLKSAQLKLKKSKCSFFKKKLYYLGHLLTTEGIKPQIEKVKAIHEMRPPTNPKGVREFLGMVGYYRKFINRFADAARPLTKLTQKDCKFIWSDECQTGFEYLRTCLTESPILKYPDPHKRYVVFTDASDQAAAAVLTQEYIDNDGQMKEMPVAYLSAQFNDTQFK